MAVVVFHIELRIAEEYESRKEAGRVYKYVRVPLDEIRQFDFTITGTELLTVVLLSQAPLTINVASMGWIQQAQLCKDLTPGRPDEQDVLWHFKLENHHGYGTWFRTERTRELK